MDLSFKIKTNFFKTHPFLLTNKGKAYACSELPFQLVILVFCYFHLLRVEPTHLFKLWKLVFSIRKAIIPIDNLRIYCDQWSQFFHSNCLFPGQLFIPKQFPTWITFFFLSEKSHFCGLNLVVLSSWRNGWFTNIIRLLELPIPYKSVTFFQF